MAKKRAPKPDSGAEKPPKSARADADKKPQVTDSLGQGDEKPENWADDQTSEIYEKALKCYESIAAAYQGKQKQADDIAEYWNIYQATPDENQTYSGNSQCYVPVVRDAINARAKRTIKQLFPTPNRHVDAVGADGETPQPQLALLESYIRSTKLKDIVRSDLVAGDVTGQWNLYIDWTKSYRMITKMIKRNPELAPVDGEEISLIDPGEEVEETEEEEIITEGPEVVDFATEDLAVVPPTCNDLEKAEIVSIRLRMSKEKVRMLIDEGVFVKQEGQEFDEFWAAMEAAAGAAPDGSMQRKAPPKQRAQDAGIRTEGTMKYMLVFEATMRLDFGDEDGKKRLGYVYYAGPEQILGIIKAPQWGGKRPVLSAPVDRIQGSFFGKSKIDPIKFIQWNLNDFWNMGQDSAMYSMLPIVMTDPLKNPQYQSLVIGLAAVWPTSPNDTKVMSFPQLWKESLTIVDGMKRQIWESMDVNEMMMGKMPAGRKNNQLMGQMSQEQQTAIMDHADRYEECMLNPLVERMFEYDSQFRTEDITVMARGEVGEKARVMDIPPQQWGVRYWFKWTGTETVSGQQMMQQQIALMNVLRGIPPQQLGKRRLDIGPILEKLTNNVYGSELGARILIDESNMFTLSPEVENEMMHNMLPVDVHDADDDVKHIEAHQEAAKNTGDPQGRFRSHLAKHVMQLQKKRQMAAPPTGQPGVPGGAPQPGVAGTPRPGAQPAPPNGQAQPPGMPHPDQAAGQPGRG